MILLEISGTTAVSYYEVLNLASEKNQALDKKAVRIAAKELKKQYQRAANAGDLEAQERLNQINQAELTLGDEEKRKKHDEELESGRGAILEIMRVQRVAPPFFWDRNARFRVIERMLRDAGWVQPAALDLHGFPDQR